MSGEVCSDDRFELIAKAKARLLEATNIEMRSDEMAVIDNILFRCWQMGWLDQLRDVNTRWHELFGTPERAAQLIADNCKYLSYCGQCWVRAANCDGKYSTVLEWLRGDA